MPWNGSGTFTRLYNFVADAAAGIKILASKQDAEWANIVTGMNNCLAIDGQNGMLAPLAMNGNRVLGVSNGVDPDDAVNLAQLSTATAGAEWKVEANTLTFVSATSYKVATDLTAIYTPGRRVKTVNTGGTAYSTVVSSAYSAPNTTLVVTNDSAVVIDSGLSGAFYGTLAADHLATPFWTRLFVVVPSTNLVASGALTPASSTAVNDRLTEWTSGTSVFTAKVGGTYKVRAIGEITQTGATIARGVQFLYLFSGSGGGSVSYGIGWPDGSNCTSATMSAEGTIALLAGETITFSVVSGAFTGGPPKIAAGVTIERLS